MFMCSVFALKKKSILDKRNIMELRDTTGMINLRRVFVGFSLKNLEDK